MNDLVELNSHYTNKVGFVNGTVADILLQDVNARLAEQQMKIFEMMEQITSPKSIVLPRTAKPTGVVRAVNQSLNGPSIKELVQQNDSLEKYKKLALKNLSDLQVLHVDTFAVSHITSVYTFFKVIFFLIFF